MGARCRRPAPETFRFTIHEHNVAQMRFKTVVVVRRCVVAVWKEDMHKGGRLYFGFRRGLLPLLAALVRPVIKQMKSNEIHRIAFFLFLNL